MGSIKDIVDLAKELESSVKDEKDLETLKQIHALASDLQAKQFEIVERDIRLMEENAELKRKLEEKDAEETLLKSGIEFRRSKKTGNEWAAFCPKCHLPVKTYGGDYTYECSAECGWVSDVTSSQFNQIIEELKV